MYRIAVCDDNPESLTQVCTTLSGSPLGKELELTPFHSGAALAAALRSGARFALLILDIELDTVDGVAIGRLLREELRDSVTQLLYISGQQQYAMALFDTRPLNFLLKPLDEAKLLDCVVQAIRLSRPEEAVLTVLVERTPAPCRPRPYVILKATISGSPFIPSSMNWCAVTSWTLWPASSRSSFFCVFTSPSWSTPCMSAASNMIGSLWTTEQSCPSASPTGGWCGGAC